MSDVSEVVSYLGGGAGAVAGVSILARYIWESVKERKDQLEERAETDRDDKLDEVLKKLSAIELDMRSLGVEHAMGAATIAEVKARIEGISNNYGARLGTIEQTLVELRTRIVFLEGKNR